ncbi:MAG: hypothetical protein FRX49_03446 [Trebouxia sp. A1-2]|nr:MAG: hypothetical protein FRX49_03446 [Trebouxia sp. A1-2]
MAAAVVWAHLELRWVLYLVKIDSSFIVDQQSTRLCIPVRQPTSRGIVRSIMERRDLRVFLQAVKPVLKFAPSLLVHGAHRLAEVPISGRGSQDFQGPRDHMLGSDKLTCCCEDDLQRIRQPL